MDPDRAWLDMHNEDISSRRRARTAVDLLEWVFVKRGFLPYRPAHGGMVTSKEVAAECLDVISKELD